jgi:hypothetical protein
VGVSSQYAKLDHLIRLMSGKVRFTALRLSSEADARNNVHARNVIHVPGVHTITVYLRVPLPRLAVSDVDQALLYRLGEWIAYGQHTLAANGGVAEQDYRVTDPACSVVKVS